jgi:predicted choloylglycine hydrolase
MRPVVMHFHPNNGDLAYIIGGWPLIGAPAIGINAAGLALSFNFFVVDETIRLPPQMRDRRALQTATTVEEGLRVFTNVRRRAMPTFMVMADATGDIAMIECTPSVYAVFRPEGDWFAQANHARTLTVIDFKTAKSAYPEYEVALSDQLTTYQLAEPDAEQVAFCVFVKTKEPRIN